MNAKPESPTSALDSVKWLVAIALLVAGFYGFYYFEGQVLTPLRVLGLLLAMGLAAGVAAMTARGRSIVSFMKAANIERQKVVWPTRQETVQTTIVVMVVVILIGILIWFLDWIFSSLVSWLVG